MSFPYRTFELSASPEEIYRTVLTGELSPFFKKAGMFSAGSMAKYFKWKKQSDSSLLGKIGYFRAKNHCVFRFRLRCAPQGAKTEVTLSVEHGPWSLFLVIVVYVLGLCMFVVGVILPIIGFRVIKRRQKFALQFLQTHLVDWDLANREGGLRAIPEGMVGNCPAKVTPPKLPGVAVSHPEPVGFSHVSSLSDGQPSENRGTSSGITSSEPEYSPGHELECGQSSHRRLLPALVLAGVLIMGFSVIGILKDSSGSKNNRIGGAAGLNPKIGNASEDRTTEIIDAIQRPRQVSLPDYKSPFSSSPGGNYSVEIHEDSQQGRLILVKEHDEHLFEETAMGYLQDVHWSPGGQFLALNERRGNSGDYLWILDLQQQRVLKRPDDRIWQELESKAVAILEAQADKKWGGGVQWDRALGSTAAWQDENTLLATITVRFLGSAIAVGEDSILETQIQLIVTSDGISLIHVHEFPDASASARRSRMPDDVKLTAPIDEPPPTTESAPSGEPGQSPASSPSPPPQEFLAFSRALDLVWSGGELPPQSIRGLSQWELRVLRNAVFARHGRPFESGMISGFFYGQPDYNADADYSDLRISPADRRNIEAIKAAETAARRPTPETSWNALRAFLDALAAGDTDFITSMIHSTTPVERLILTLNDPPKIAHSAKLSGASDELRSLWLDDGGNGESYCFMMSALWDLTGAAHDAGNGTFRNSESSLEVGFTEISGRWWLTRVADSAP